MASGTGIGEFFVSLTVDAASGAMTVGNLVQSFGALEIATVAEIGLLWELGVQLARITDEGIKAAFGFEQFTMHTGLSAQELQKWQIIAEQSHASAQDVTGSVENLTKHLANLAIGIPDSSLASLQQLGISAFGAGGKLKTAFDILGEVQQRLGVITKDAGQQERILAGLGISPNLRETLLLTQDAAKGLGGLAHGMTAGQEAELDGMYQRMKRIELVAKDIAIDIAAWVASINKASGALDVILTVFKGARDIVEGKNDLFKAPPLEPGQNPLDRRFDQSLMYKLFFAPNPNAGPTPIDRLMGAEANVPAVAGAGAASNITIDKHDTYIIHDAHNPEAVKGVIERHWDDLMSRKTVDGFDRQNGNSGY